MKQLITVHDSKSGIFTPPVAVLAIGEAIRTFEDAVNDPQSPFNKHPEDYTLFHIGSYDETTASVEMLQSPLSLGGALNFVKQV